jgi:hypothetical protein
MSQGEKAVRYRKRAEQLKSAAKSNDLGRETRLAMLELADNYEKLADLLELPSWLFRIDTAENF